MKENVLVTELVIDACLGSLVVGGVVGPRGARIEYALTPLEVRDLVVKTGKLPRGYLLRPSRVAQITGRMNCLEGETPRRSNTPVSRFFEPDRVLCPRCAVHTYCRGWLDLVTD